MINTVVLIVISKNNYKTISIFLLFIWIPLLKPVAESQIIVVFKHTK